MAKIPSLKKMFPESPDQIQRFSTQSEAALARMAHLNRLGSFVGNDIDNIAIPTGLTTATISKPCALVTTDTVTVLADDTLDFTFVFNEEQVAASPSITSTVFAQGTGVTAGLIVTVNPVATNGTVTVTLYNATAADIDDPSFFLTIVPQ